MNGKQKIAFLAICAVGVAAAISGVKNASTASAKSARDICKGITNAQILKGQQIANQMGLFPGRYGEVTEIDERVWVELPKDSKVAAALTVYCSLDKGQTSVMLRGWRDGETKASIVNGNYWD